MKKSNNNRKIDHLVTLNLVTIISLLFYMTSNISAQGLIYRVGFLGAPDHPLVEWNNANMEKMKVLGFNTMQLNIAWGSRPNDEVLNLEDVVNVPSEFRLPIDEDLSTTLHSSDRIEKRSEDIKHRIKICKQFGFHTIFQFGAPFAGHPRQEEEPLPQCISDSTTVNRYISLIKEFNRKFPGVDDLMMYTYDQDAWLGSEFGPCAQCHGVPVSIRVAKFVNILAHTWRKINPKGKLWWEPWELSAGEVYDAIMNLDSTCVGLAIHSNIAEVQIAFPAGRWFKNVIYLAVSRKIPVIGEVWLGCPTEEMEPLTHIPTPLLTLQELKAVCEAGELAGIKEYYGNVPEEEDPNLRMTGLFFNNPGIDEATALNELSKPYKDAAIGIRRYWSLVSEAVAFYPWDVSWHAREVGRSNPVHLMTAATLKGASWQTPSWQSSRRTHFMRTDETNEPNFWMREDMELRFKRCADLMEKAIQTADSVRDLVPVEFKTEFNESLKEVEKFKRSILSYQYHLRETNLAEDIRISLKLGLPVEQREKNIEELREILIADQENEESKEPIQSAINMLDTNLNRFLHAYFMPSAPTNEKGDWSITSN